MNGAWMSCVVGLVLGFVAQGPGIVGGVVKNARGGAVLPRYLLELHGGSRFDRITSDEKGRFASSVPFAPGDVEVRLVDDDAVERKVMQGGLLLAQIAEGVVKLRYEGKPLEVAAAAGPTYRLKWKSPEVEGSPSTPGTSSAEIVWVQSGLLDPEITLRAGVRIESDGSSWVRFAPVPEGMTGHAHLRIVSIDGLWKAESPVEDLGG